MPTEANMAGPTSALEQAPTEIWTTVVGRPKSARFATALNQPTTKPRLLPKRPPRYQAVIIRGVGKLAEVLLISIKDKEDEERRDTLSEA